MLRLAAKLLILINSETEPAAISTALCLGLFAGLTPLFNPLNIIVLFILLLFRLNISAFILSLILFSGIAYIIDPLFHHFGLALLTADSLNSLWTLLYNSTFWRLTNFNNSVTLGSTLFSLLLFAPLALLLNSVIRKYREHIKTYVNRTRIMLFFKASRFYKVYSSANTLRRSGGL